MSKEKPKVEYSERFREVTLTIEDGGMLYCDVMTESEFAQFVAACSLVADHIAQKASFEQRLEELHREIKALHAQAQDKPGRYYDVADCLDRAERYIASALEVMPEDKKE